MKTIQVITPLIFILLLTCCTLKGPAALPPSPSPTPSPTPRTRTLGDATKKALEKLFEDAEKSFPGTLGISFYDIESGYGTGLKKNEAFPAASVIKVPFAMELIHQKEQGTLDLEEKITLTDEVKTGGSGIVKDKPAGTSYTIKELCAFMITKSDNTATDMLITRAGMDSVNDYMKSLGLTGTSIKRKIFDFDAMDRGLDNVTTPADMNALFFNLYRREKSDKNARDLLTMLTSVERKDMLPAGLPPSTVIAHKTGELQGTIADTGIIYQPGGAYVLCLMGKNVTDRDKAVSSLAGLSKKVFDIMGNERGNGK